MYLCTFQQHSTKSSYFSTSFHNIYPLTSFHSIFYCTPFHKIFLFFHIPSQNLLALPQHSTKSSYPHKIYLLFHIIPQNLLALPQHSAKSIYSSTLSHKIYLIFHSIPQNLELYHKLCTSGMEASRKVTKGHSEIKLQVILLAIILISWRVVLTFLFSVVETVSDFIYITVPGSFFFFSLYILLVIFTRV